MQMLSKLTVSGFRSIRDMGDGLELRPVNVVIGANGCGKSNLVAVLRLLQWSVLSELRQRVGESGGAASQLYYGPKQTQYLSIGVEHGVEDCVAAYQLRLHYAAPDRFLVDDERVGYGGRHDEAPSDVGLVSGVEETKLRYCVHDEHSTAFEAAAAGLCAFLLRMSLHHFNDTTATARVMRAMRLADNSSLKHDGANLACVLHRLREQFPAHYERILATLRQVVPFFGDFVLDPVNGQADPTVLLQWRERGSDLVFGPHQLSDGTLRFMMLATLLLMPNEGEPRLVVIDEPELGLHPAAITALSGMVYTASDWTQVILTTQSPALLDEFAADDVIVASRLREGTTNRYETRFDRLSEADLEHWEGYSLGELWDKNVLGGRPTA